jgi:hypothetical protein
VSVIHNIIPKFPVKITAFHKQLKDTTENLQFRKKESTYYYWIDGKSTRGVDVTFEKKSIEIRNTILSNEADFELTNKIARNLLIHSDGIIINEENEICSSNILFTQEKMDKNKQTTYNLLMLLLARGEEVTIFGPNFGIVFDNSLYEHLKKSEEPLNEVFDIILWSQYHLPDYEFATVMKAENPDNEEEFYYYQIISNEENRLIAAFDYVLLVADNSDENILITYDTLCKIHPPQWILRHDKIFVAPKLNDLDWDDLLKIAAQYNLYL